MKIYPNISRLWGKNIREAGMTKNQARKVLQESEKTQRLTQEYYNTTPKASEDKASIQNILKKLNIF